MTTGATSILYSSDGYEIAVSGGSANSASNRAIPIAGSDGSNNRLITLDTSGRTITVGAGAAGAAVVGNPVRVAGSDGTNTRDLFMDSSGRIITVGAAASGAAAAGNPVLTGGSDGTNARTFRTATDGTLRIDPTGVTTQPISGSVTVSSGSIVVTQSTAANLLATVTQGPANTLANAWPIKLTDGTNTMPTMDVAARRGFITITDGTNTMPTGDVVGRAIFEKITDGTNTAAVKAASTAATPTDTALVVALSPNNTPFAFGGDDRLRIGQETLLFFDNVEGTTVDTNKWTQSQSGMTQSQTGGNLTLNNGNSTTSGNYSILTSTKQMFLSVEFPIYVQYRAKLVPQTNAVIELGFGNVATTAAPTDGVFIRVDSAGVVKGVINFNGTETLTASLGSISSTTFYNFEVTVYEDHASFEIMSADGATNVDVDLAIPNTQGSPTSVGHLPAFARVYNSSATSAGAQIVIASANVQQMDLNMNKSWSEQAAGAGRSSLLDPSTLAQSANYTNNTGPVSATLSNTAAGYTTLGGLFQFAAVAGAETDYALFAYQVPTGFQLYVWTITITAFITGAQSSTNPTLLQWAVAANSSAVSLATGAPNPPIRTPIGMQQANKTANIGDTFNPGTITYAPKTPIVINSGKYLHIILRIPISNATTNQIIRGSCTVEGYFE